MTQHRQRLFYQKIFAWLAALIGHKNCYLCHQASHSLVCEHCEKDLVLPLFPSPAHNLLEYDKVHNNLDPPHYVSLHALGAYQGILAGLISKLKFSGQVLAGEVLAKFFCKYLQQGLLQQHCEPSALIPIPLSNFRHANREFNQASVLCKHLSKAFDIPVCHALLRKRHTKQQSSLNKDERLQNIHQAFTLLNCMAHHSVAIVDDVITTGATVNEACRAIHAVHPDVEIHVWCMAVTLKDERP